ncbi:alcohol dehydrogenase catalytic domain-containing protein [Variovorax robiniae]|uniref:Alcohol dehydrogenase catalytic domain-containing protein n=1 Tax=Variovorax robiniae TaxID=1836199 RepID=A0ABU8X1E1_9BURK
MKSKAVVFRGDGQAVGVEDILVDPPGPGEVMIKLAACGVCHSDLSVTNGTLPCPRRWCWAMKAPASSRRSARA